MLHMENLLESSNAQFGRSRRSRLSFDRGSISEVVSFRIIIGVDDLSVARRLFLFIAFVVARFRPAFIDEDADAEDEHLHTDSKERPKSREFSFDAEENSSHGRSTDFNR